MSRKSLNIFHIRRPGAIQQAILGCVTGVELQMCLLFNILEYYKTGFAGFVSVRPFQEMSLPLKFHFG